MATGDARTAGVFAHRILVVDDDADSTNAVRELLEQHGYEVLVAKDGGQANSSFVMRKPDFVILDLILPGASGFEVCQQLKSNDPAIPVMVLTVIDMDHARDLAERVGADGYLTKPARPDLLLETVAEIAQEVWERNHAVETKSKDRIRFRCRCGKKFRVSPLHIGKTLTCPECGEPIVVPRSL